MERYSIISECGRGGSARVYKAYDRKENRIVAIKYAEEYMPLMKEYHFLNNINMSGVPKVYDFISEEDCYMVVMEYISGKTMEYVINHKEEKWYRQIEMLISVCRIISYFHENKNVLYLDLKPSNIIINSNRVYLIDYGSVQNCLETEGECNTIYGTLKYAATEQLTSDGMISKKTDIYQIGCVLEEIMQKSNEKSKYIDRIIERCKQSSPEKRYACIREIITFLCEVIQYEGIVYRKKVQ